MRQFGDYFCPATNREGFSFLGKMRISGKIIQYPVMFTDSPLSPRYEDDNLLVGTCHLSLTCPAPAWSVKSGDFMSVSVSVPTLPHCPPNKGTHLLIL